MISEIFRADGSDWFVVVRDFRPAWSLKVEVMSRTYDGDPSEVDPDELVEFATALLDARAIILDPPKERTDD